MALVLDCSITLSWFFPDERTAFTEAALDLVEELGELGLRFEGADGDHGPIQLDNQLEGYAGRISAATCA